jgi:RNA polymerase sigma-70 factor (ECF subfamily)
MRQGGDDSAPSGVQPDFDSLVMKMARNEPGAFDTLFRLFYWRVYRTAVAVIRDPAQAEEVVQEAFIEVWRAAGQFDPGKGTASAWMLTIARRRAIDRVRSAAADARRDHGDRRVHASWDNVSEAVQAIIDREQLACCLDELTGPQRQAIILAFYGGHTYAEVATILGIAVGTAKSRIRAGLAVLRQSMRGM